MNVQLTLPDLPPLQIESFLEGAILMFLIILLIGLIKFVFFRRPKHDLSAIKDKIADLNEASETIKKNSVELNKIMEDLEYA